MKKLQIIVEESKIKELTDLFEKLPYVKQVKESNEVINSYTLASKKSLGEDWLLEDDDELQKLYGK
ncbi:MAG: hypothetical protein C4308_11500 [Chitinophagaceae bacterium]